MLTEMAHEHLSPWELCQLNAHRKARVVAKKHPDALVLGADTLVFLDDEIMGKPVNLADATPHVDAIARTDAPGRYRHQPDSSSRASGTHFRRQHRRNLPAVDRRAD